MPSLSSVFMETITAYLLWDIVALLPRDLDRLLVTHLPGNINTLLHWHFPSHLSGNVNTDLNSNFLGDLFLNLGAFIPGDIVALLLLFLLTVTPGHLSANFSGHRLDLVVAGLVGDIVAVLLLHSVGHIDTDLLRDLLGYLSWHLLTFLCWHLLAVLSGHLSAGSGGSVGVLRSSVGTGGGGIGWLGLLTNLFVDCGALLSVLGLTLSVVRRLVFSSVLGLTFLLVFCLIPSIKSS